MDAVEIVENWSKEHPVKTKQSEFLKYYPNAVINKNTGALVLCPSAVFGGDCKDYGVPETACDKCCKNFWLGAVEG